ncbi:MAG: hypothetical protein P8184_13805, partial [Calditrichia bacterium]
MEERKYFPKYGIIGFFIIVFSEAGLILRLQFFETFMTPLCWTGLILLVDAWNYRRSGNSYIMNRRKELLWMALWS